MNKPGRYLILRLRRPDPDLLSKEMGSLIVWAGVLLKENLEKREAKKKAKSDARVAELRGEGVDGRVGAASGRVVREADGFGDAPPPPYERAVREDGLGARERGSGGGPNVNPDGAS